MATDTLMEQAGSPCEYAPIKQLDEMLRQAYFRADANLKGFVHGTASDEIRWDAVRHLRIVGQAYKQIISSLNTAGLPYGFYSSADGSWMLIVTDRQQPEAYVKRCNTNLESLRIIDAEMSTIPGLENQNQLTSLDLSQCYSITELPELGNLTLLTSLNLSGCESLTELPGLEKLTQLTSLNLSGCRFLIELPGLEKLIQLTSLDLSGCQSLTQLPGLEKLTHLTSLDLSWCESFKELPELGNLTQLTSLDLSQCYSLTDLPGLGNLTQLTSLDLPECDSLKELPGLENLTQLTSLKLSGCESLTELPEGIRHLESLRNLDLCFLHLRDLPDWLPEIAERFDRGWSAEKSGRTKAIVSLHGTTVDAIPDMSIFDQPYEMVVKWFEERKLGRTHPLNEIKVVFLGDGEAGKSHTIARLMNDGGEPVDYVDSSTPGIAIRNKEYDLAGRTITVHYWDFGGQEIMHSMHRIFLTGRTMYVVLLNARDDTQGDRARYWLHNIQSFAPGAPVLLVLNKIDQNENASVNENDLRSRYEKLTQIVRLSALKHSREEFNDRFTRVLLEEIKNTGFLDAQWPNSWNSVKKALENMTTHYIQGDDYEDICRECQVDDHQEELLLWFNDLGVSFCCRDPGDYALKDYVILRPDWITNALYIILFNPLRGAGNGLIPHSSIFDTLRTAHKNPAIRCTLPTARYNAGDIQYVLGIMRKFSLSFPHGTDHEFIPMLCQQNSMVNVQDYHKDENTLEFNMDFDYLPNNLLHRLMVERYSELDITTVWRTGARFHLPALSLSAVVVIDGNTLRFFICGTDPMHRPNTYLTMLKAHVDRILAQMGLKAPTCQLVYKLDGKQEDFDYGLLQEMLDAGVTGTYSRIQRKQIPIADILNQSAPADKKDQQALLEALILGCRYLQGNQKYWNWGENDRNTVVRDTLRAMGYFVYDQSLQGLSGSGQGTGELDLDIRIHPNDPWTICEALIVTGYSKKWNEHLDKLLNNYNPHRLPVLYLLTYVDCEQENLWDKYQQHIREDRPTGFDLVSDSVQTDLFKAHDSIKVAKCSYQNGTYTPTVYHIFARIPTQNG